MPSVFAVKNNNNAITQGKAKSERSEEYVKQMNGACSWGQLKSWFFNKIVNRYPQLRGDILQYIILPAAIISRKRFKSECFVGFLPIARVKALSFNLLIEEPRMKDRPVIPLINFIQYTNPTGGARVVDPDPSKAYGTYIRW